MSERKLSLADPVFAVSRGGLYLRKGQQVAGLDLSVGGNEGGAGSLWVPKCLSTS